MRLPLYIFTMFLGIVLTVHLAMNGKVGSVMNNARVANALFWCIGALGAVAIGLTGWESGALGPLKQVHPVLLFAGVLGASLVFAIAWLIPQVGAGSVMITLLAGQVIGGLLMSHDYNAAGVRRAVDEFFSNKPEIVVQNPAGQHCLVVKSVPAASTEV